MAGIVNTEMYFFNGNDGYVYIHFPIRGYAIKTSVENEKLLIKLQKNEVLSPVELNSHIIKEMEGKDLFGFSTNPLPDIKEIDQFKPIEATLLLTESCNLACSYCYAKASNEKFKPMSKEIAKAAVDLVINNAKDHKHKTAEFRYLGGGEPTIEWDLIVWITNYIHYRADEEGVKYWIRLITNGVLITEDKAKWISKNIHYVTLSCDILPELQANRSFPNGKNSHKAVMRTANILTKYGVPCHFRTTISFASSDLLKEMVEYTYRNTDVKAIRFEPMAEIGRASETEMSKPEQQAFVDAFIDAYELGKQYGIYVTCKMMTNIVRRSSRFCNVEFAITSEGNVAGCHRYSRKNNSGYDYYHVGKFIDNRFIFDLTKINNLRKIDASYFSDCKKCFARWSCASGCLSARLNEGEISPRGPLCHLTRELLKFSIKDALNR